MTELIKSICGKCKQSVEMPDGITLRLKNPDKAWIVVRNEWPFSTSVGRPERFRVHSTRRGILMDLHFEYLYKDVTRLIDILNNTITYEIIERESGEMYSGNFIVGIIHCMSCTLSMRHSFGRHIPQKEITFYTSIVPCDTWEKLVWNFPELLNCK
jgi:hypothetical protein